MKITSVECYLGTGAIGGFVTMMMATRLRKWTTAVRLMMAIHFPK